MIESSGNTLRADSKYAIQDRFLSTIPRCLTLYKVDYIMREVHEGVCKNHLGARSLVHKLIRTGYYCPTM